MTTTIGVFLGSVRDGRFGEAVANWVMENAMGREGFTYQLLDLKEFDVPHITTSTMPAMAKKQYEDEEVTRWSEAVDACDGYVFISPEYNHSVPGTMKNAFDSLYSEWVGKPVAFVSYGGDGGIRAVEHWRQIVGNLSMFDVRNQVPLLIFGPDATDGEFTPREEKLPALEKMLGDLEEQLR